MTAKYLDFNDVIVYPELINGIRHWPMRDLGVLLDYDAKGGNLSRQVRNGFCDRLIPVTAYVEMKTETRRKLIWLTEVGVSRATLLVMLNDKKRKAIAWKFLQYWVEAQHVEPIEVIIARMERRLEALETRLDRAHISFVVRTKSHVLNHVC